jgi:ATP-dependent Lhr-like helicase
VPPPLPLHILAQQLLALALQERGIGRGEWFGRVEAVPAFGALEGSLVERIVAGMLERQVLWDEAGVLWLGREGQDAYGRKNFLDLVSVFTAPPLFTVLHGRHELGSVDESTFLSRRDVGPPVLLLAGRAWRAVHLDWRRRRAYVEPAEDEGRSRWRGEGQFLGAELCRAIRRVLAGDGVAPEWSRRATGQMAELRGAFSWLDGRDENTLISSGSELAWWTFGGGRANAALACELSRRLNIQTSADNFAVRFGTTQDPRAIECELRGLRAEDAGRIVPDVSEADDSEIARPGELGAGLAGGDCGVRFLGTGRCRRGGRDGRVLTLTGRSGPLGTWSYARSLRVRSRVSPTILSGTYTHSSSAPFIVRRVWAPTPLARTIATIPARTAGGR